MNQDEFKTLLASLASQYAEACEDEIEAIKDEMAAQQAFSIPETYVLDAAYGMGKITGKNAELRKVQCNKAMLDDPDYMRRSRQLEAAVLTRKRATAVRVGVEHKWKTWRAWLASQASQGGGE